MNQLIVLLALLLYGCSTPSDNPSMLSGKRIGTVVQVGDAASFGPLTGNDCRSTAGTETAQRYASVQYFSGRHAHVRIVPLTDGFEVAEGDQVYVKTSGCKDALSR